MDLTAKEKEVRNFLIERARSRTDNYIFYQELSDACKLGFNMQLDNDSNEMGQLLSRICTFEHSKGRPLLSGIVLKKDKEKGLVYGNGFYVLFQQLHPKRWKNSYRNSEFTAQIINECVEFWKNETHYLAFRDDVN